jgi:hypothetical protein
MTVNLSELLAALPDDNSSAASPEWAQERLREIIADLAQRPAPVGSLHRMWTVSELSAQIALAYLALWMRRWGEFTILGHDDGILSDSTCARARHNLLNNGSLSIGVIMYFGPFLLGQSLLGAQVQFAIGGIFSQPIAEK